MYAVAAATAATAATALAAVWRSVVVAIELANEPTPARVLSASLPLVTVTVILAVLLLLTTLVVPLVPLLSHWCRRSRLVLEMDAAVVVVAVVAVVAVVDFANDWLSQRSHVVPENY
uniref:Uncharacterized protein n=1 Tax=Glossina palpalis gambiensis TaxID=67801 RepID=A0A1B0AN48_9MUSC